MLRGETCDSPIRAYLIAVLARTLCACPCQFDLPARSCSSSLTQHTPCSLALRGPDPAPAARAPDGTAPARARPA